MKFNNHRPKEVHVRRSAYDKIMDTAKQLRSPRDGAEGAELALSSVMQGVTSAKGRSWLEQMDNEGELDAFLYAVAVWLVAHVSDDNEMLLVIPVPRNRHLPPGTLVHRTRTARDIALGPPPDLIPDKNGEIKDDGGRLRARVLQNGLK